MNTPLLTVTLTNYNYERYLRQTIESVLSQSFGDFELIISDNVSTDGSPEIIREYARRDPRIRAAFQPVNKGHITNLRWTCDNARGAYRLHLDADDYLADREAFALMVGALNAHPDASLVFSAHTTVTADDQFIKTVTAFPNDVVVSGPEVIRPMLEGKFSHSGTMIRMDAYRAVGGYNLDLPHATDLKLYLDVSALGKIVYLDRAFCRTRIHRSLTSTIKLEDRIKELSWIIDEVVTRHRDALPDSRRFRDELLGWLLTAYPTSTVFSGKTRDGLALLASAVRRHPLPVLKSRQTYIVLLRALLGEAGFAQLKRLTGGHPEVTVGSTPSAGPTNPT
jgi:glycosyltransferase involved in cell wall biosynthesis